MKFNILIECLEPECSVINFHWHPVLHYHVSWPNYICINNVRLYYHEFSRYWRGKRRSYAVWRGKDVLKGHWPLFFSFSCNDPQKCWGYMSLQCGESESGRFSSKWGFKEASIGNIKSQSLNNHWHEWLSANSSSPTEESLSRQTICLWPIVWDQWKINLSHLDNVKQT